MSPRITFVPPPWLTALLLRSPSPTPTSTQPRTPPSAMRDLVAQWLVHVTEDPSTQKRHPPHVIARFRGWLAFVFRIPSFIHRPQQVSQLTPLSAPQFNLIQQSLYSSSSITKKESSTREEPPPPPPPPKDKPKKKEDIVNQLANDVPTIRLSPLYKSLYFSVSGREQPESIPPRCASPLSSQDMREGHCVQSFFLTDASGEGKGILEGLKEIKAQTAQPQRKRGWVPAVVSLILIALNPLK